MKYENLKVLVPYFDAGMKHWVVIKFDGIADTRLVKRVIRKYCKQMFNKRVDDNFIKFDCRWMSRQVKYDPNSDIDRIKIDQLAKKVFGMFQDEHEAITIEQARTNSGTKTEVT